MPGRPTALGAGKKAEEVGEAIPEVVIFEENGVDAKSFDYPRLVALLIEASQEQQSEIEARRLELVQLKANLAKLAEQSKVTAITNYGMK